MKGISNKASLNLLFPLLPVETSKLIIIPFRFFCHQASNIDVNAQETFLPNSGGQYQFGVLSSVYNPNPSLSLGLEAGIQDDVGDWSN